MERLARNNSDQVDLVALVVETIADSFFGEAFAGQLIAAMTGHDGSRDINNMLPAIRAFEPLDNLKGLDVNAPVWRSQSVMLDGLRLGAFFTKAAITRKAFMESARRAAGPVVQGPEAGELRHPLSAERGVYSCGIGVT